MQKNKIIYSLRVNLALIEAGFMPIDTIPNPKFPRYDCWIFEYTSEFEEALNKILGGISNDK